MPGQGVCQRRDAFRQSLLDPDPLGVHRRCGIITNRLSETDFTQGGTDVHGHKGQGLAAALVTELCKIDEMVLEIVQNVIEAYVMLRED